jgi:hypothetical protein
VQHLNTEQLMAGLDHVRSSPSDDGRVELIVRRPERDLREVVFEARLDPEVGLVGDSWLARVGGAPNVAHLQAQLTLMNARCAALVAVDPDRRQLAGDQVFVDFDLSHANSPAGSQLQLGSAVVEISELPHTGCRKFSARFGDDALAFVNSEVGRELRLRGVNTRVIVEGTVRVGDAIRRVPAPAVLDRV